MTQMSEGPWEERWVLVKSEGRRLDAEGPPPGGDSGGTGPREARSGGLENY